MNRLAAVLDVEDVKVDVPVENKLGLFLQAAQIFARHHLAGELSVVTDSLLARERLGSTGLGHGVAIPHCRLKGLKSCVATIIRSREPLDFGGPDDEGVTLFVFLFVPEMATQSDLEILAEIAEMLSDRGLRDRLKHEGGADALFAAIAGWFPASGNPDRQVA